jgi:hypothetical protein
MPSLVKTFLAHPAAQSQAAGERRGGQRVQVRLAGQPRVERLELAGRLEQKLRSFTTSCGVYLLSTRR